VMGIDRFVGNETGRALARPSGEDQGWSSSTHTQLPAPITSNPEMERVMGIEPTPSAWKAEVLPLNYTRLFFLSAPAPRTAGPIPEICHDW
jgi:hypothetical protein